LCTLGCSTERPSKSHLNSRADISFISWGFFGHRKCPCPAERIRLEMLFHHAGKADNCFAHIGYASSQIVEILLSSVPIPCVSRYVTCFLPPFSFGDKFDICFQSSKCVCSLPLTSSIRRLSDAYLSTFRGILGTGISDIWPSLADCRKTAERSS